MWAWASDAVLGTVVVCKMWDNQINKTEHEYHVKINDVSNIKSIVFRIGYIVATHAWKSILISLVIFGGCLVGLLEYQKENRDDVNWIPQWSISLKHQEWVGRRYPFAYRLTSVMLEKKDGDLLTVEGLKAVSWVHF